MSTTDQNTPAGKQGRRSRKSARNPKPKQAQSPQADQVEATEEPAVSTAAPAEAAPIEAAAETVDTTAIEAAATEDNAAIAAAAPDDTAPIEAPEDIPPVDAGASDNAGPAHAGTAAPVSLQTIASAYGDYTRRSLEETRCFVEKLKGAKSLDKAVEAQTEFAQHAFETFVTESRKIYGLHKELARQTLKPLETLMNKPTRDQR